MKKKNGKNKGKITRERNKVLMSLRVQANEEARKRMEKAIRQKEQAEFHEL